MSHSTPKPLTYSEYIGDEKIVKALDLPTAPPAGVQPDAWPTKPDGWTGDRAWPVGGNWVHDEVLFIRTHQAFEVWFSLIIHELSSVIREAKELWSGRLPYADPKLSHRMDGNSLLADNRAAHPKSWRVVEGVAKRDPDASKILNALWKPAQKGVGVSFKEGEGETALFNHALARWIERLDRASKAMHCTIPFFDVLSTMTPASFLAFRGRLQPASGFGSAQFREIEYLLGLRELNEPKLAPKAAVFGSDEKEKQQVWSKAATTDDGGEPLAPLEMPTDQTPRHFVGNMFYDSLTDWGRRRVAARARETSLRDVLYGLLRAAFVAGSGTAGPEQGLPDMGAEAVDQLFAACLQSTLEDQYRNAVGGKLDPGGLRMLGVAVESINEALVHQETVAATLIDAHPDKELFATFLESCLNLDRALLHWRDRHIRFVEGMIGTRAGTGGGGVRYLRGTVVPTPVYKTHAFPCLWQARSFVQRSYK